MVTYPSKINDEAVLEPQGFQQLLAALKKYGYQTVGPRIRDQAIVLDELDSISDLPVGWKDTQNAGTYRLEKSAAPTFFGYALGPHSWKKYLHPAESSLWRAQRTNNGFEIIRAKHKTPKYAFFGVRPCELNAIAIFDKVFATGDFYDPLYRSRRRKVFIVAVNCTRPGGTCFCASMNTGPQAKAGFDIALTEVQDRRKHYFIVQAGSKNGIKIFSEVTYRRAEKKEIDLARGAVADAAAHMGRSLDTSNLKSIFDENFEHHHWEEMAEACLTCGNCTMVCPTCFCYTVEDSNSIDGEHAERRRKWDSCFTREFSYIHGGGRRSPGVVVAFCAISQKVRCPGAQADKRRCP